MRHIFIFLLIVMLSPISWGADLGKGLGAYQKGDYATALREWTPFAEQGNAIAQYGLGVIYNKGMGVEKNPTEAMKWYRKAAEQGHASAQVKLGIMYLLDEGVIMDAVYSHMWLNIALSNGAENAGKVIEIAAKKLTPQQLERAQQLARECVAKDYKGC